MLTLLPLLYLNMLVFQRVLSLLSYTCLLTTCFS
jgi:hypothetical protein